MSQRPSLQRPAGFFAEQGDGGGGHGLANSSPFTAQRVPSPPLVDEKTDYSKLLKALAEKTGIPCRNLIHLHPRQCARGGKSPALSWVS